MDQLKDAWEALYSGQSRPWRGVADISWIPDVEGLDFLDLGCGNGKTSQALIARGANVTGIDFSESAIASCRKLIGDAARFEVADVRSLPFSDGSFDAVVSVHVLEHVPAEDISKAVGEVMRVIRPGGCLYLKCFAEGDMRSDGKKEDVRNGILYRYSSEEDIRELFSGYEFVSLDLIEDPTRFGTVRRRYECVIRKN